MSPLHDLELNYARPDCVRMPGMNIYAPKVLLLFEERSFRAIAPLLIEMCEKAFRQYAWSQLYYDIWRKDEAHKDFIEAARIFGARFCYVHYSMIDRAWLLVESEKGVLGRINEYEAMLDKRFVRDLWRPRYYEPAPEPKPKIKNLCNCGFCDLCLGL